MRLSEAGWRALEALENGNGESTAARLLGRRLIDTGLAHPRPKRPASTAGVTVVVPVRDRPRQLRRRLQALGEGNPIVVVDDGSRDHEAVLEVARDHRAAVLRHRFPAGPGAARNTGLTAVKTELVAFLDSDCVPSEGWLGALTGHFEDPLVAAVGPRVRPLGVPRRTLLSRYLAARSPLDLGPDEARVELGTRISWLPTAALMVRSSALGEPFDPNLRHGEDVDLIWRLRKRGHRVRYDPGVVIRHDEPRSLRAVLGRRFRYGTSAAPLSERHPGCAAPFVFRFWPTLTAVLLVTRRPGAAGVVVGQQGALLSRRLAALGFPPSAGGRWFAQATYDSALGLAGYAATTGLPLALAASWWRRRPATLAMLALPALQAWYSARPDLDPLRWTALALLEDAAYGAGVWAGCLRARRLSPLVPTASRRQRGPMSSNGVS